MTRTERVLHRVVLPAGEKPDVLPLYVTGDTSALSSDDRFGITVPVGASASLRTYVNAFPAAYWQRWSALDEVCLRVRASGSGSVLVRQSDATGQVTSVATLSIDSVEPVTHRLPIALDRFSDGGWVWCDLVAGSTGPIRLQSAEWTGRTDRHPGTVTLGITTFNRQKFCTQLLAKLGSAADVLPVVYEVIVVDQGTTPVSEHPGFADVEQQMGTKLRVVRQANLGGSGGFSRAMDEALRARRSDHVILLDDDVALREPESILRLLAFADLARTPTVVGGHMLDLLQPCTLNLYAEVLDRRRWWPGPADATPIGHNLADRGLADASWLHRQADADFNGWWLCLVPLAVVRSTGLTLPAFIKWDDIEYGLRAAAAGYPTVTLPGAGIWHMPWYAKNTATDWLIYFQTRNRLMTALSYVPGEPRTQLLRETMLMGLKYAMTLQFSAAELLLLGLEDILRGPELLHAEFPTKMDQLMELVAAFPDAQAKGKLGKRHPELVIPLTSDPWWLVDNLDSVLVTSADGVSRTWGEAERTQFAVVVRRLREAHDALSSSWGDLAARYRAALPELTSPERWRKTFATPFTQRTQPE